TSSGNRTFTTNDDDAYFSIDGADLLARFNQDSGGDYGDWWTAGVHQPQVQDAFLTAGAADRKSTRLNSSHEWISYAVSCLKKKKEAVLAQTSRLEPLHPVSAHETLGQVGRAGPVVRPEQRPDASANRLPAAARPLPGRVHG